MGILPFLFLVFVVWLFWPQRRSSHGPEPQPSDADSLAYQRRRWRYIDRSANARGSTAPVVTPAQLRLPVPENTCALCTWETEFVFHTARIALCKTCVDDIRKCCGGEIGRMQHEVLHFLRLEWPHTPPSNRLAIALAEELGSDGSGRSRDADLAEYMNERRLGDWRVCLRAYHLGLTATWPPEFRPDDEEWKPLAHRIRVQDDFRCNVCGHANEVLHVHHIIPLSEGGTNDPSNLVTLCHGCHLHQHPGGNFSRPDSATT